MVRRFEIDITDFYNDILIFVIWYTAWNIFDVIFKIRSFDNNTIIFAIILVVAITLLISRATWLDNIM